MIDFSSLKPNQTKQENYMHWLLWQPLKNAYTTLEKDIAVLQKNESVVYD